MERKRLIDTAGSGAHGESRASRTTPGVARDSSAVLSPAVNGTTVLPVTGPRSIPVTVPKRKRDSISGIVSSPGSVGAADDEPDDKRSRHPGVKRACNECRQQKVSQSVSAAAP